uniref:Zinc finger MYM-type protein 1-like n=1 Tax=Diabrotica virgifera virgifera TaxID=50390 RepID=A0A6P7GRT3_DIAVI
MRPQGETNYLSPTIQNELIELLASHLRKTILNEIHNASFFSVIFDTTQDIAKVDQLSEVYRYVKIEKSELGKPTKLEICEVFFSFIEVKDQTAEGLADEILKTINSKGLDLSKCRGQGYDGAAVMSGVYNGVQRRIKDKAPNAYFVHCAAHNLNLVVKDAVENNKEICNFFDTIQSVYCFFGHSIVRWEELQSTQQNESNKKEPLKSSNPTRWAGRLDAVSALKHRFCDVLKKSF